MNDESCLYLAANVQGTEYIITILKVNEFLLKLHLLLYCS